MVRVPHLSFRVVRSSHRQQTDLAVTKRWAASALFLQNLANGSAALGDRQGPAGAVRYGHVRVDAQTLEDGGANVGWRNREVLDISGLAVGLAVHRPAADAAARKPHRVAMRPVVA